MYKRFSKITPIVVLISFTLNSLSYGLGILPASQNVLVRREIVADLAETNVIYAASDDDFRLLNDNNAKCLLLSSGKYLVNREKVADDLSLMRAIIHEDVEALMQIMWYESLEKDDEGKIVSPSKVAEDSSYAVLANTLLEKFPPDESSAAKPEGFYLNDLVARAFDLMLPVAQGLVKEEDLTPEERGFLTRITPVIIELSGYSETLKNVLVKEGIAISAELSGPLGKEFWDAGDRKEAIREALAKGFWFYKVGMPDNVTAPHYSDQRQRLETLILESHSVKPPEILTGHPEIFQDPKVLLQGQTLEPVIKYISAVYGIDWKAIVDRFNDNKEPEPQTPWERLIYYLASGKLNIAVIDPNLDVCVNEAPDIIKNRTSFITLAYLNTSKEGKAGKIFYENEFVQYLEAQAKGLTGKDFKTAIKNEQKEWKPMYLINVPLLEWKKIEKSPMALCDMIIYHWVKHFMPSVQNLDAHEHAEKQIEIFNGLVNKKNKGDLFYDILGLDGYADIDEIRNISDPVERIRKFFGKIQIRNYTTAGDPTSEILLAVYNELKKEKIEDLIEAVNSHENVLALYRYLFDNPNEQLSHTIFSEDFVYLLRDSTPEGAEHVKWLGKLWQENKDDIGKYKCSLNYEQKVRAISLLLEAYSTNTTFQDGHSVVNVHNRYIWYNVHPAGREAVKHHVLFPYKDPVEKAESVYIPGAIDYFLNLPNGVWCNPVDPEALKEARRRKHKETIKRDNKRAERDKVKQELKQLRIEADLLEFHISMTDETKIAEIEKLTRKLMQSERGREIERMIRLHGQDHPAAIYSKSELFLHSMTGIKIEKIKAFEILDDDAKRTAVEELETLKQEIRRVEASIEAFNKEIIAINGEIDKEGKYIAAENNKPVGDYIVQQIKIKLMERRLQAAKRPKPGSADCMVVGVYGPSSAGKTTFSRYLADKLDGSNEINARYIGSDSYLHPGSDFRYFKFGNDQRYTYLRGQGIYDLEEFLEIIKDIKSGKVVTVPADSHDNVDSVTTKVDGKKVNVLVLDLTVLGLNRRVLEELDVFVPIIFSESWIRHNRRIERDARPDEENGTDRKLSREYVVNEFTEKQFEELYDTMFDFVDVQAPAIARDPESNLDILVWRQYLEKNMVIGDITKKAPGVDAINDNEKEHIDSLIEAALNSGRTEDVVLDDVFSYIETRGPPDDKKTQEIISTFTSAVKTGRLKVRSNDIGGYAGFPRYSNAGKISELVFAKPTEEDGINVINITKVMDRITKPSNIGISDEEIQVRTAALTQLLLHEWSEMNGYTHAEAVKLELMFLSDHTASEDVGITDIDLLVLKLAEEDKDIEYFEKLLLEYDRQKDPDGRFLQAVGNAFSRALHTEGVDITNVIDDIKTKLKDLGPSDEKQAQVNEILDSVVSANPKEDIFEDNLTEAKPAKHADEDRPVRSSIARQREADAEPDVSEPIMTDARNAANLILDVMRADLNDDRTFTVRCDEARLTASQMAIVEEYVKILDEKISAKVKLRKFSSARTGKGKAPLINVVATGKGFKGEGNIDVEIPEGKLEDYFLRIIGMVNIALASSAIPENITDEQIKTTYSPVIGFIMRQYREIVGSDIIMPRSAAQLVDAVKYIVLMIPKADKMPLRLIDEYNRLAKETLQSV